jgi:hypothetical protein
MGIFIVKVVPIPTWLSKVIGFLRGNSQLALRLETDFKLVEGLVKVKAWKAFVVAGTYTHISFYFLYHDM